MEQPKSEAKGSEGQDPQQPVPEAKSIEVPKSHQPLRKAKDTGVRKSLLALPKDPRAVAAVASVAGFLVGLLVFYKPWRLQPDLGDAGTWVAAIFAAVAGWIALHQLRILQEQVRNEAERADKRDKLLDQQLAEAEERAVSYRRRQAEGVTVRLQWTSQASGLMWVTNGSQRPITDVTSKVIDKTTLKGKTDPDWGGIGVDVPGYATQTPPYPVEGALRIGAIVPGQTGVFNFRDLTHGDEGIVVIWFTDDAKSRWQLDEQQHLAPTTGDEYQP